MGESVPDQVGAREQLIPADLIKASVRQETGKLANETNEALMISLMETLKKSLPNAADELWYFAYYPTSEAWDRVTGGMTLNGLTYTITALPDQVTLYVNLPSFGHIIPLRAGPYTGPNGALLLLQGGLQEAAASELKTKISKLRALLLMEEREKGYKIEEQHITAIESTAKEFFANGDSDDKKPEVDTRPPPVQPSGNTSQGDKIEKISETDFCSLIVSIVKYVDGTDIGPKADAPERLIRFPSAGPYEGHFLLKLYPRAIKNEYAGLTMVLYGRDSKSGTLKILANYASSFSQYGEDAEPFKKMLAPYVEK